MVAHIGSLFFCFSDSSSLHYVSYFRFFPFSRTKASAEHSCILSHSAVLCCAVLRAVSPTLSVNFYLYLSESTWLHFQILVFCFQKIVKRTWNHEYLAVRKVSLVTVTSGWSNGSSLPRCCIELAVGCLHPELLFSSQAHCGLFTFPLAAHSASTRLSQHVCCSCL